MLIEYLPPIVSKIREIKEICAAEQPEFDLLEKRGERIELIQMNFSTRNWFSRLEYITYNPNYIKITEEEYNMHLEL